MPSGTAPRVSAIIVVRNGEEFLAEAIDSIVNQSFTAWELIVVDDGSTDSTCDIVRRYTEEHGERVRLLVHPDGTNRGIAASRNLGIAHAAGRYIGFLDADDVWLQGKLSEQVAILESDPELGLVYGRTLIWHSWSRESRTEDFYYPLGLQPDMRYDPPVLFRLLLENRCQTPTTCNALMRAAVFRDIGQFESRFRLMFEDQTFFAKALAHVPAFVSSATWARYRQHAQSCSALSQVGGGDELSRLAFLRWLNTSLGRNEIGARDRLLIWHAAARTCVTLARRLLRHRAAMQ